MDFRDTVVTMTPSKELINIDTFNKCTKNQARVSFKAGIIEVINFVNKKLGLSEDKFITKWMNQINIWEEQNK